MQEYRLLEHLFDTNDHSRGWYLDDQPFCSHDCLTQALATLSRDGWTVCGSLTIDDTPTIILTRKKGSD